MKQIKLTKQGVRDLNKFQFNHRLIPRNELCFHRYKHNRKNCFACKSGFGDVPHTKVCKKCGDII